MWVATLKIRHDCIMGNRCRQFRTMSIGMPFSVYTERGITYAPQIHTLYGRPDDVRSFINSLARDPRVRHMESDGDTVFLTEVRKDRIPSTFYNPRLIMVRPVEVDLDGYEYWRLASWERGAINAFILAQKRNRNIEEVSVLSLRKAQVRDVYVMHLFPELTGQQKRAIELALEHGYYSWPKRTDLKKLAKMMGVSVQTYREHLKRAEGKLMPEFAKAIK